MLFDASIAHNIRYGVTVAEVSDEDIVNAAKMANIHDFVQSLPQVSVFEYRVRLGYMFTVQLIAVTRNTGTTQSGKERLTCVYRLCKLLSNGSFTEISL